MLGKISYKKAIFLMIAVMAVMVFSVQIAQACTYHAYTQCYADRLYWYDSCGNIEDVAQYCSNGCSNNQCNYYSNNNTNYNSYHAYQRCVGNGLYWYDSYGNQQDMIQWCQDGCYNNQCQNNNYNNNYNYNYYTSTSCTYHAYKLCSGNNIYWYDSCGNQQDLYQSCNYGNQTCQYGSCVNQPLPTYTPAYTPPQTSTYASHYRTACYQNNIYWYDSLNQVNDLYKDCSDANTCTQDTCSTNKCSNTLKCDGSTCAVGSADYTKHCATSNDQSTGNPSIPPSSDGNTQPVEPSLALTFLVKPDIASPQWQKTAEVKADSRVYFMISIGNNSDFSVNNIGVQVNIPSQVASLGNLQLNGVPLSGDIVSGISVASLAPHNSQVITFEGQTQAISAQEQKQALATINVSDKSQNDALSLTFVASLPTASVAGGSEAGFVEFLKRWYIWILLGLVLIFLFIVVFRRLSKNS